jgi:hypothetical protein
VLLCERGDQAREYFNLMLVDIQSAKFFLVPPQHLRAPCRQSVLRPLDVRES